MRTPILIAALCLCTRLAAAADDPKTVVEQKYAAIQKIIAEDKTDEGVRTKVTAVLESFTDFDEFGRLTLKEDWPTLKDKQRALFIEKFKKLVQRSYSRRFKANQPLKVDFDGAPRLVDDKALVKTRVESGKTRAEVDYKLLTKAAAWKVYDIVIDDVSLVLSYRKQFTKILKRDGFDKLIEKMTKKIESGQGELDEP